MAIHGIPMVFMFSGQGSQYYHMGRVLFDQNAAFRKHMLVLNEVARELLGASVIDFLYNDQKKKDDKLDMTVVSSAAIFMVEYSVARVLIENDIVPDYLLGSSMGTYVAASIANCFGFELGLTAIIKLAEIVETICEKGCMLAVFCGSKLHADVPALRDNSEIAAVNFASHFVISSTERQRGIVERALSQQGVTFQALPVTRAFHSRWIDEARVPCLKLLGGCLGSRAQIPIICCSQTNPFDCISPELLWDAVRKPIQFERTIARLEDRGSFIYVDVGPSGTLATFLKYGLRTNSMSRAYPIMSPFSKELSNLGRLLAIDREN
jgi:acyl transferase domain-containing protein